MGATETIAVEIADSPDNYYSVAACLRGPDLRREARQVEAMINSTTLVDA